MEFKRMEDDHLLFANEARRIGFLKPALVLLVASSAQGQVAGFADSFDPNANFIVEAMAVQADGKVLVGGLFSTLGGQSRGVGRVNADGSLDTAFNPGGISVWSLLVQKNGQILVGGAFGVLDGETHIGIGRLNADGSLDANFNLSANNSVHGLAEQADGKILVGGEFTTLGGQPRNHIARLNADGSLDNTFNPGADDSVLSLALQAEGKILVGGQFSTLGGEARVGIGRLNADGGVDATFNPGANGPDSRTVGTVHTLVVQTNGQILVGGRFGFLSGQPRDRIGRLNADGSLDTAFNPGADDFVFCLALQTDGKILVGGEFSTLGGNPLVGGIGRLYSDGSLDSSFVSGGPIIVQCLVVQADGKILVGGQFSTLGGQPRNNIGRLYSAGGGYAFGLSLPVNPAKAFPQKSAQLFPAASVIATNRVSWDGAQLSVAIVSNYVFGTDSLGFLSDTPGVVVSGNQLNNDHGQLMGTFEGAPGTLVCHFYGISTDEMSAVVRALAYTNSYDDAMTFIYTSPPPRTVSLTLTVGDAVPQTANKSVQYHSLVGLACAPVVVTLSPASSAPTDLRAVWDDGSDALFPFTNAPAFSDTCPIASVFPKPGDPSHITILSVTEDQLPADQSSCTDFFATFGPLQVPLSLGIIVADTEVKSCVVDFITLLDEIIHFLLRPPAHEIVREDVTPRGPLVSTVNFHALEQLMKQTAEGRRLVDLYWQHSPEVLQLLLSNPPLRDGTLQMVRDFQPGAAALLAGDGHAVQITQGMVDELDAIVSQLASLGSPNLRATLETEGARFNGFQDFINRDFNQWAGRLGVSVPTNAWIQLTQPYWTNRHFSVQANGVDGLAYSLWRAPGLPSDPWQQVTNALVQLTGFTLALVDPAATPPQHFYQVQAHPLPPMLLSGPANQRVTEGSNTTFSASASGLALAYQWQFNGTYLPNATASSLMLTNVQLSQAGAYAIAISNRGGAITSAPALLIVTPRPSHANF